MNTDAHRCKTIQNRGCLFILSLSVFICVHLWTIPAFPQTVAPGADAQWATAGKQAVGTANSPNSKVWFTLAQGVMTEVYYPDVMTANVHMLQFVVVDPKTKKVETELDDATHRIELEPYPDAKTQYRDRVLPMFAQVNTAKNGNWKIWKFYEIDPDSNAIFITINFEPKNKGLQLYLYYDPSLANSGMNDTAWNDGDSLLAQDGDTASALISSAPLRDIVNGFYQTGDGLAQLRKDGKVAASISRAEQGNVTQTARIVSTDSVRTGLNTPPRSFRLTLAFGKSTAETLETARKSAKNYTEATGKYKKQWINYRDTLPVVDPKFQRQFDMAAMQLKAHEDKSNPGANVASLSIPWGGGANANENNVGGYHLVWSRDLYQVATAFMALGDTAAANRALDFVLTKQQRPDGSFPQNSKLDGTPFWTSLQMDEVAFPLILAWQLGRNDKEFYEKHIKKSADFIVKNGPATPQERWEEEGGYSPSTIAAEIAGLVCAAEMAKKNGDTKSAELWLATADDWARNVEKWTATTTGKYGDGNYYLRITANGKPDSGDKLELNNGAGTFDERDIVDAGFLELVRLGIKPADDPLIIKSLKVVDQVIKVDTPNGPAFYRYNQDGYGEMEDGRRWNWDGKYTGKGRLWALLSGERGQYELARHIINTENFKAHFTAAPPKGMVHPSFEFEKAAYSRLDHMLAFANDGLMIPEQIWDKKEIPKNIDKQFIPELKFGEGTGSATPLAWSMAQFIRLATNLKAGRNLDTPQVVYDRYKNGIPAKSQAFAK